MMFEFKNSILALFIEHNQLMIKLILNTNIKKP